jgi:prepilin-type N-terminal cleavage/methylation domain-containing protein
MTRRNPSAPARRGFTILELIVAMTVLVAAGLPMLALAQQSRDADRRARAEEMVMEHAHLVLESQTMLPRRDLDLRIGDRTVDGVRVRIARPERPLYRIAVLDTTPDAAERLVTVVFRPIGTP